MRDFRALTKIGQACRLRALARNALLQYDLDVCGLHLISNDLNGIFRVDLRDRSKWILRVALPETGHTMDHLIAEMDWLGALARDTDVGAPRPLSTRRGEPAVEVGAPGVPEPRLCAVYSWLPGTRLQKNLTSAAVLQLGTLSARLHQHAGRYQPPQELRLLTFDRVSPFSETLTLFDQANLDLLTQPQISVFKSAAYVVQKAIDSLRASGEPMRILHGDLHLWNVLCHRGRVLPIDFEDLMLGWPVQDIAISLYYIQDRPDFPDLCRAFRNGYQEVCPWPERHPGEVVSFMAARGIGLLDLVIRNRLMEGEKVRDFARRIERRLSVHLSEYL